MQDHVCANRPRHASTSNKSGIIGGATSLRSSPWRATSRPFLRSASIDAEANMIKKRAAAAFAQQKRRLAATIDRR
jgi:hypothetical protein